ncbi:hypothetical protein Emed_003885 [Eimeria media]
MVELVSSSEDECVFTGAKAGGLPPPVRERLLLPNRGIGDAMADLMQEEVAQVVICNDAAVEEDFHPFACGSPAAAAKRRALRNQERLRTQLPDVRSAQETHRHAESSGASTTDKNRFLFDKNEKVLDVRCLKEVCGRGQSQGESRDIEDSGIALWGGSLEGRPDWLPLPGKQVNAKGERVEWLRHARYGVGTFIDIARIKEYIEYVKDRGQKARLAVYGRKDSALREKVLKKQADVLWQLSQMIRCMEGKQNFIRIEKCGEDHSVQLVSQKHQSKAGHAPQHFRAVACLGDYDVLPAGTVLGPPYGGALRPAAELAMMQMVHDRLRNLPDPPRQCYAFRIDNLEYIGKWEGLKDKEEGNSRTLAIVPSALRLSLFRHSWPAQYPVHAAYVNLLPTRKGAAGDDVDLASLDEAGASNTEGRESEVEWQASLITNSDSVIERRPVVSLQEIHEFVFKKIQKLSKSQTLEEAAKTEQEFYTADPEIKMYSPHSSVVETPELDAMDFRSEYSMMNDAKGAASRRVGVLGLSLDSAVGFAVSLSLQLGPENNCNSLMVFIAGLPYFFAVTKLPVRNGDELFLSYGPHYWQEAHSTEMLLSSTYELFKNILQMALRNKETVICAKEKQNEDICRLQESMAKTHTVLLAGVHPDLSQQASEKATIDIAEQLEQLDLNKKPAEDRAAMVDKLVSDLKEKLQLGGRVPGIMAALETTANASARGDDPVQILMAFKFANECLRREYSQRKEEVQAQVKQSEQALRLAEEANQQLQKQLLSLQTSSKQQTSRIEHMQAEMRRLNATSQKHVFDAVRIASSRSFNAENNDISELIEEAESLATGEGNLLEVYFNMLSRDAVLCQFLYDLLCCLANTFARMSAKHRVHSEQWRRLRWSEHDRGGKRRCLPNQQQAFTTQAQEEEPDQELEEGELERGSPQTKEASDTRPVESDRAAPVTVDGSTLHNDSKDVHETATASEASAKNSSSSIGGNSTSYRGDQAGDSDSSKEGGGRKLDDVASEASGTSSSSACALTANDTDGGLAAGLQGNEDSQKPACLCGGRICGDPNAKGICLGGATGREARPVEALGGSEGPGMSFDIGTWVLEHYGPDPVDKATDWVGWLLELPVLKWRLSGESEEERRKKMGQLMFDFPLLLHAVFAVCCNNCLGFALIPPALNENNWLGEFLESAHVCLEELERRSRSTPALWVARLVRAVETSHKALDALEEKRSAADVQRVEKALALRSALSRRLEALRNRRVAAFDKSHDSCKAPKPQSEEELEIKRKIRELTKSVQDEVPLYLDAWKKHLAGFVDERYSELFLREFDLNSSEEADKLLGKSVFSHALELWPQLRAVVLIGAENALRMIKSQPEKPSEQIQQETEGHTRQSGEVNLSVQSLIADGEQLELVVYGRVADRDPGIYPCPLLLLHCDGDTAQTVMQRGDFLKVPKEVRHEVADGSQGARGAVFRYLLPPTPVIFQQPIDLTKSGCLLGHLPAGRTDNFTVDAILRLPLLTTDGSGLLRGGRVKRTQYQYRHPQEQQQRSAVIYDPIICTVAQHADSGVRIGSANSTAATFGSLRIIGVLVTCEDSKIIGVTLKCAANTEEEGHHHMMRVTPFVNGEKLESLSIPNMSDFRKISSIREFNHTLTGGASSALKVNLLRSSERAGFALHLKRVLRFFAGGVPGVAHEHPAIQVVDRALELLYLRVFSCDFNPEELPPPDDPRLQLPGQRYTSYSFESEVKEEQSVEQQVASDGASQCANDSHPESASDCSAQKSAFDQEMTPTNTPRPHAESRGNFLQEAASCHTGYTAGMGGQPRLQEQQSMLNGLPHGRVPSSGISRMQVEPLRHAASAPDFVVQRESSCSSVMQQRIPQEYRDHRERASERGRHNCAVPPFIIRKSLGNQQSRPAAGGLRQHGEQPQQRSAPNQSQLSTPTGHEERVRCVKAEENR